MENSEKILCGICEQNEKRYQCPKCDILYCSLECYKHSKHLACSEAFYKDCVQEELNDAGKEPTNDIQKMLDILKRMKQADESGNPEFFDGLADDPIDSDDDEAENGNGNDDDEDLGDRLNGVNLDDPDEVWNRLTLSEQQEFEKLVESGNIMKLLPDAKPWWCEKPALVVDITEPAKDKSKEGFMPRPEITTNIVEFSQLCKKDPSPSLHYNLWNIMAGYSCVVRFYAGDHLMSPIQALSDLVNICLSLKFGTNFDDVEDAITSVMMETLTTKGPADTLPEATIKVESRELLQSDAKQLMSNIDNKLAALSDILTLFKSGKRELRDSKNNDMFKLYALCSGSVEIDKPKLNHLIKKIEFMLAYVRREK